jgi:hypothetical protein
MVSLELNKLLFLNKVSLIYIIYFYILLQIYKNIMWAKKNVQNILKKLPDSNDEVPCAPCQPNTIVRTHDLQEPDDNNMQIVRRGRPTGR